MIRVITFLTAVALTLSPSIGLCVEPSYDCIQTGHTNIGWSAKAGKYTTESMTMVGKPGTVKLSELNTERPFLMGQGVTRLQRLANDGDTTWFAEQAPAGTVILWTFFGKRNDIGPPTAVLISTKTYDFFGPVSFTDLYACTPNLPTGGR
jgi:hypothetical protein